MKKFLLGTAAAATDLSDDAHRLLMASTEAIALPLGDAERARVLELRAKEAATAGKFELAAAIQGEAAALLPAVKEARQLHELATSSVKAAEVPHHHRRLRRSYRHAR